MYLALKASRRLRPFTPLLKKYPRIVVAIFGVSLAIGTADMTLLYFTLNGQLANGDIVIVPALFALGSHLVTNVCMMWLVVLFRREALVVFVDAAPAPMDASRQHIPSKSSNTASQTEGNRLRIGKLVRLLVITIVSRFVFIATLALIGKVCAIVQYIFL